MNIKMLTAWLLSCLATILAQVSLAQDAKTDVLDLVERARGAAGSEHVFLFRQLCASPIEYAEAAPAVGEVTGSLPANDPDRDWYTEPVQVFDDLFYLG